MYVVWKDRTGKGFFKACPSYLTGQAWFHQLVALYGEENVEITWSHPNEGETK